MDFFVKAKLSINEGFSTNQRVSLVKNPLVKPSLSIVEGFSTIEGSTIEGFQCICCYPSILLDRTIKIDQPYQNLLFLIIDCSHKVCT